MQIDAKTALYLLDPALLSAFGVERFRRLILERDGSVVSSDEQRSLLHKHRIESWPKAVASPLTTPTERAQHSLYLESELRRLALILNAEDIEYRLLKGLATASLDYPEPGLRDTGDIDILISPADLQRLSDALQANGFTPQTLDRIDPLLNKGSTFESARGCQIDVHTRLNKYDRPGASRSLMSMAPSVSVLGPALPPHGRLFHAATHLTLTPFGHRRASGLIDIAQLAYGSTVDEAELRRVSDAHGQLALAGATLRMVDAILGRQSALLTDAPSLTSLERLAHFSDRRRLPAEHLRALVRTPRAFHKFRYAQAYLVPSAQGLRARGGVASYIRRASGR